MIATQNPIESEGVYPLPEAQRDRFLLKVDVPYPRGNEEFEILRRMSVQPPEPTNVLNPDQVRNCRTRRPTCSCTTWSPSTSSGWCWPPGRRPSSACPT